uniref:Uncharacterized protein n=1 Tax=Electrophorus electricus TaxID=8005 RepID=A0AAY5EMN2_ELEEL
MHSFILSVLRIETRICQKVDKGSFECGLCITAQAENDYMNQRGGHVGINLIRESASFLLNTSPILLQSQDLGFCGTNPSPEPHYTPKFLL